MPCLDLLVTCLFAGIMEDNDATYDDDDFEDVGGDDSPPSGTAAAAVALDDDEFEDDDLDDLSATLGMFLATSVESRHCQLCKLDLRLHAGKSSPFTAVVLATFAAG